MSPRIKIEARKKSRIKKSKKIKKKKGIMSDRKSRRYLLAFLSHAGFTKAKVNNCKVRFFPFHSAICFGGLLLKSRNTSCLPCKIVQNHCEQFLLGQEDVTREIENNAYANFW